jgi:alpha-L-rhamnosidase
VHSDTPESGSFATSNPLINKLQSNITWGQRSNFFSVPTDCPQRDERLGWMGDAQMFVGTSAFNMDVAGFFTKWMRDVEDAQRPGGAFTDVAPDVCCGAGTAGWGDAGVIVPWAIYERYGDARVIERHYDAMQRWIDYLEANSEGLLRPAEGYGDWLNAGQETPRDVIGTAFFVYSTDLVARMARVIGRDADAERYEGLRDRIKAAFNGAYVSDEGRIKGDTQTAYVLALHMDLLPEELRDAAAARLVELIEARGWHLSTGFLGTPHLLDVLTEAGYGDVAHRLLNQDTVPSWLYMVKNGATTIWERWDSILPDGSLNDPGLNSLNHYGFGSVGDWMYRRIGAIAPGGPGYEHVLVKPDPGGDLTEAKAKYQSIRGEIEVEWEAERDRFKLAVTIPANATATVSVPTADPASVTESGTPARQAEGVRLVGAEDGYAVYEVGSGKYAFEAKRGAPVR